MQPIDPADPRRPFRQIAASIRAAILADELEPGAKLPSGDELAKFYGVTRTTVASGIRLLQDEGFVRSVGGSGVYVRELVNLPADSQEDHALSGVAAYLFEAGSLKGLPRAGWLRIGVRQPESVADHSFRVGLIGMILAALEGADLGHTAALCLVHDTPETRTGDVTAIGRAYLTTAAPEAVAAHQTAGMPAEAGEAIRALVAEYETGQTQEAKLAKDADKLDTLCQALEYQAQGFDTQAWRQTSAEALRTKAGQQLAQAIGQADPAEWWTAFGHSYHELRAAAHERARDVTPEM